ncbi:MAG TPA: hypothetical protein VN946_11630 [Terriglobales bacterium]|jgi:hypothetical protein|nr:hypothetical protein [Terriglobales bacterium]
MSFLDHFKDSFNSLKEPEQRLAWAVAIVADVLQIAAFPLFIEGGISPADSVLDLVVAFVMIRLLGWHWAFLPTAAAKLIPGADLFPTWTTAVWFVTRQRLSTRSTEDLTPEYDSNPKSSGEVEILPPGPAPEPRR